MKKRENYPFWFYFDDDEDDYDEDAIIAKRKKLGLVMK